jgi:NAD(P)-dependent dehydrogenase (short-subunit alcohol dehydrogenase family)
LFTRELARRLTGTKVDANCFHPGGVRTGLMEGNPARYRAVWAAASPFLLSAEKGADTGVYLASSPEVEGITGKYFAKRKQEKPSDAALDDEAAARLWTLSEQMTGS